MSKTAIIYTSRYGATETYAKWLAEDLNADLLDSAGVKPELLLGYDTLLFGGGIYVGAINGVKLLKRDYEKLKGKRIAVFAVCLTPAEDAESHQAVRRQNFPGDSGEVAYFPLPGALDPARLTRSHKAIASMLRKVLEKKSPLTSIEQIMLKAFTQPVSLVDREQLGPVLAFARGV